MIAALVRGKLSREQENMEDLLTSIAFGQMRYVSYASGLRRFLEFADDPELLRSLPEPAEVFEVDYKFWPWMTTNDGVGCEPDLLITISRRAAPPLKILVEAKFLSGKSSEEEQDNVLVTDQLAREWACFVQHCDQSGAEPFFVYLTNHHGRPEADIEEAAQEFSRKVPRAAESRPLRCAWLSWRHLSQAFSKTEERALKDLHDLAQRMGFRFFDGIHVICRNPDATWTFRRPFAFADSFEGWSGRPSQLWSFQS